MMAKKWIKIVVPTAFLLFGLATIVYPKITGEPLTPVYKYHELKEYSVWEIPIVYIFSYATRAWGPLLFAFMLGGFFSTFISKEKMISYFSSKSKRNYFIAAPMASIPSMLGVSRVVEWKVLLTYAILAIIVAIISGLIYLGLGVGI